MVYGARRMGKHIAYTWTGGLPQSRSCSRAGTRGDDGIYRDSAGKPVPFTQRRRPRSCSRATSARSPRTSGTIGVLDDQDLMMHTLFDSPKEQAIADTRLRRHAAIELRRCST